MARLIDADALGICKANRNVFDKPEYADGWNSAVAIVEDAPTVDAVEVIRCRECKYYIANYCTRDINGRTNMFYMRENDFCSCGERRMSE